MDQRRNQKEYNSSYQSSTQNQPQSQDSGIQRLVTDFNISPILNLEEEINKTFKKSKKVIHDIKVHDNYDSLCPVSLDDFISITSLFLDSSFTSVLDKRILFAAFAMIHQFYLSSNFAPTLKHMLPFTTLWDTFQKTFTLLDFDKHTPQLDETLNKIKFIIDNGKQDKNDENNSTDDYDDIIETFSLLFQCCETLKLHYKDSFQIFDKCFLAIENTSNYLNDTKYFSNKTIREIQLQLSILKQIIKSQQKTCLLSSYVNKINSLMSSIPSSFDKMRLNSSTNYYNDQNFPCRILKTIIDFYSIFINLTVDFNDWKEAQSLFVDIQKIYSIIEQPSILPNNNSNLIQDFCEKILSYSDDRLFKDNLTLKELNATISILPPELYYIRSSFSNFLAKRKEIPTEFSDSQKFFFAYQAFVNFSSKLAISNGPIYDLSYRLLQIYSKSLINSVVYEYVEIVNNIVDRINLINMNKNGNTKIIEANVLRMMKATQDLLSCEIINDAFKSFLNRYQLLLFFFRNILARIPSKDLSKYLPSLLKDFPNFKVLEISTSWLTKDLGEIFQKKAEMAQNYLSQNENPTESSIQNSTNLVVSSFGLYGQIVKENDIDVIKQYKKFYRFKKCAEDFAVYLNRNENPSIGEELLLSTDEFSELFENILQKTKVALSEIFIFTPEIIKNCFYLSNYLMYIESSTPIQIAETYELFLKNLNLPFFKQKLQSSIRYLELFVLMKNEGETERDDNNSIDIFCQAFVTYCSFFDEESLQTILNLYPTVKNLIPNCSMYYFDNIFETFKKFESLFNDINQINTKYITSLHFQNPINTYDAITFINIIESFSHSIHEMIKCNALSNDSHELIKKIFALIKEITPISLFSLLSSINHSAIEKSENANIDDSQIETDKKTLDLKEFIKNLSQLLTNLINSVKFTDFQINFNNHLSAITSMLSYYMNWCPEFKFPNKYFNDFIQLSHLVITDFPPALFRMLRIINIIFTSLKKLDTYTLEVTLLHKIAHKVNSIILNALNIFFFVKDLKVIQNCIHSFSDKYQIADEKSNFLKHPMNNFFNYQKINSSLLDQLYEAVQKLYLYDSRMSDSSDKLAFAEVYDILTPALSVINNLFDESTPHLVSTFFNNGCSQIKILTSRLETNIKSLDNNIREEKALKSINKMDDSTEDQKQGEYLNKAVLPIISNKMSQQANSNDPILNMYQAIIEKKTKQNKSLIENIDGLNKKLAERKEETLKANRELINYTTNQIPSEFAAYSNQLLEPLKDFQSSSNELTNNSEIDVQNDIFAGSEFNENFANSILMKINELEQQNGALSRYINVQKFFSVVDDYIKNHQNRSELLIETANSDENKENEKIEQEKESIVNDDDNDEEPENDDDEEYEYEYEFVDDDERISEFEQFEQDEIKLIMMINSLRSCGKNNATLREFVSNDLKEGMSHIELEFYKLIDKACQIFNISKIGDEYVFQKDNNINSNNISKSAAERKNLLKIAKSMVQDVSSDDNDN